MLKSQTKIYLSLLKQFEKIHVESRQSLQMLNERYIKFLQLAKMYADSGKDASQLIPSLDMKMFLSAHLIHPVQYMQDVSNVFGDNFPELMMLEKERLTEHHTILPSNPDYEETEEPEFKYSNNVQTTKELWENYYKEPYELPPNFRSLMHSPVPSQFSSINLVDEVIRHKRFGRRLLRLEVDDKFTTSSITRYGKFFNMIKDNPGTFAIPTLDIDTVWHAHMLSHKNYKQHCEKFLNRVLNHKDDLDDTKLANSWIQTEKLWVSRC